MKINWTLLSLSVLLVVGCGQSKDRNKQGSTQLGIERRELKGSQCLGSIQDNVNLNGVIVLNENTLHESVKIDGAAPKENKNIKLSQTVADEDKKSLDATVEEKKYVSMGCKDLSASETAGLEKVEVDKANLSYKVSKIFICGGVATSKSMMSLIADEIVLKAASIKMDGEAGNLLLSANKLTLQGSNSVVTQSKAKQNLESSSSTVILTVAKEIKPQDNKATITLSAKSAGCVQQQTKR